MLKLLQDRPTVHVEYKNAANAKAGELLRWNSGYVQQTACSGSAGAKSSDTTTTLLAGIALDGSDGAVTGDAGASDEMFPVKDGDLAVVDLEAGVSNTITAGKRGGVYDLFDAGTVDLRDTTLASKTLGFKLLQVVSGMGDRYGTGVVQIIYNGL